MNRPARTVIFRLPSIDGSDAGVSCVQKIMRVISSWLAATRDGPAVTAREIRVICAMILFIVPIALGLVLVSEGDFSPSSDTVGLGGDFPQFFMSGWLLNHHPPSGLYDLQLQARLPDEMRPAIPGVMFPYLYPPFLAIGFRPFSVLPYPWAYGAWSAISVGLYVAGLLAMFREFGPFNKSDQLTAVLLALAFEPFLVETLAGGQISSIAFFCLAFSILSEQRNRSFLSGIFLSVCLYKPTLLTLFLPMLVLTGRWRILAGFFVGGSFVMGLTVLSMGPAVLADYVRAAMYVGGRYIGANGVLRGWKYVDLRAFMTLLTGDYLMGLLALAAAAFVAVPALARAWWSRDGLDRRFTAKTWALTIVWTLLLNVYVPFYDSILVVLAFILMAHSLRAPSHGPDRRGLDWLMLSVFVISWFSQAVARVSGIQIFTLVLTVVAVFAGGTWGWRADSERRPGAVN